MFGLREQISSNKARIGFSISNNENLRGTCGHINGRTVRTAADLALGFGDVGVARPEDLRDGGDRFGAESHGSNRLSAAHLINLINAAQTSRCENRIGNRRRRAENDAAAAGDLGRNAKHQHCGKERCRAARNIEADGADRASNLLTNDAGHGFDSDRLEHFSGVKFFDIFGRGLKCFDEFRRKARNGSVDLCLAHLEVLHFRAVEFCAEVTQRCIAAGLDFVKNA